ncbi:carbohydrate ABC transporter permease [Lactimicrobium massiliense]|uniref:carbohydrate ABC transporter permease n=1 Tax=Lactimicrobium massiliense TaxID=2161814 RepID=UPI000D54DEE8|nr:carbohydrate ABC transporter permease [Lactimicrobium massiliense]
MNKRTKGEKIFSIFNTIILSLLCVIFLLPIWHVAMGSISDPLQVAAHSGLFLKPLGTPTLGGYKLVMQNSNILRSYGNTILYVVVSTFIGLVLNILAAYIMSRKNLMFGKAFSKMVVFTMIFNGGLVPTFIVMNKLGLYNTRWAVILPGALTAFNIIIMRTSFMDIPEEMIESARIDGADDAKILTRIILPVSKEIVAVIVLFYAVQHWNEWFNASIYLQDRSLWPLQLVLREIVLQSTENSIVADASGEDVMIYRPLIKYATIMISIIPMMILYPFVQKYFVTGVMVGSVKG